MEPCACTENFILCNRLKIKEKVKKRFVIDAVASVQRVAPFFSKAREQSSSAAALTKTKPRGRPNLLSTSPPPIAFKEHGNNLFSKPSCPTRENAPQGARRRQM
jgi:hypothetical protein